MDLTVLECQRIHGTCRAGSFAQVIDEPEDCSFVRCGDVEALAAGALELTHGLFELFGRDTQQFVLNVLASLLGEETVDYGRPAMRYRVAHHAVAIDRHLIRPHLLEPGEVYLFVKPARGVEREIGQHRVRACALDAQQRLEYRLLSRQASRWLLLP